MKQKTILILTLTILSALACTYSMLPDVSPEDSTITVINDMPNHLLTIYSMEVCYKEDGQEIRHALFKPKTGYTIQEHESATFGFTVPEGLYMEPWDNNVMPEEDEGAYLKMTCKIVVITSTGMKMINPRTPVYIPITIDSSEDGKHVIIQMSQNKHWRKITNDNISKVF